MKTLRFEDRDWIASRFMKDENGRLHRREEYEKVAEFREVLRAQDDENHAKAMQGFLNVALAGGVLWGAVMLVTSF